MLRRLDPEIQAFNTSVNQSFDYNGIIVPMSDIPQGTGPNQRDGNVIHAVSLDYNLRLVVAATSPVTCRFLICRLLQPESGLTVSEVIDNVGSGLAPNAQYNTETHGQSSEDRRIEILYDRTVSVSTSYKPVVQIKGSLSLGGDSHSLVRYSGSSLPPVTGAYVGIVISSLAGPAGLPAAVGTFRLHFLDA